MQLITYKNDLIVIQDKDELYTFTNLASYNGYYQVGKVKQYWRLAKYTKQNNDNLELQVTASFNRNTSNSSLRFGYHPNNLIRREVHFDQDSHVTKDFIAVYNPLKLGDLTIYKAEIEPVSLDEYMTKEHVYKHKEEVFPNRILPDSIIELFYEKEKQITRYLNQYASNPEALKTIIENFGYEPTMKFYTLEESLSELKLKI